MSTTPPLVSSPRANSVPPAYLAPSSAQVISNLARERLEALKSNAIRDSFATSSVTPLSTPATEVDMYYIKLTAAIISFKTGEESKVDEARQIFREAIAELPKTDDLDNKYAHAVGLINFAATYEAGSEERNNKALLAQPIIFEIYDRETTSSTTNKDNAHPMRVLLNELSQMLTDKMSFTYNALMGKIGTMNDLYGELPASTLLEGFPSREVSPEASPLPSPRVSKDPVEGSGKATRIFIAFAIASLVIAGCVFALYQRVTKIN